MNDINPEQEDIIIADALALALVALESLPIEHQPEVTMEDLRSLLAKHVAKHSGAEVAILLAMAKCRLNPHLDPTEVYRSYGITR